MLQFLAPNEAKPLKWGKTGDFSGLCFTAATNNDVSRPPHYFTAEMAGLELCQKVKHMQAHFDIGIFWIWNIWMSCPQQKQEIGLIWFELDQVWLASKCNSRISPFLEKDCLPIAGEGFPVDWSWSYVDYWIFLLSTFWSNKIYIGEHLSKIK